ncbi:MAG TPA: NADH-quinone oxidoreductase subunit F, partial [Candidatus Brocadiia bacterium]|nr:NADH-quinone oxidoreductase subunit F [Candidatus Brocadiia bacterium]
DEGDPGAFMDRLILESDPHRVIEGMVIAAYAVGASKGVLYIRAEYPLAVINMRAALIQAKQYGFWGADILGSGFDLDLEVVEGAGAFVCGEETALMAAIEGRRGMPRLRPPYPSTRGLMDRPTLVNNVETLACVPWILREGPAAFRSMGTPGSPGTKVFALAGKVRFGGL